jgi:hypothetical protein
MSMAHSRWPFPQIVIPTVPLVLDVTIKHPNPLWRGVLPPAPSIDSEPQEIECEELSELDVCIPEGDE